MTMKSLTEVLAKLPSDGSALPPVKPTAPRVTERDTQVVSKLLDQLKLIFPRLETSLPDTRDAAGGIGGVDQGAGGGELHQPPTTEPGYAGGA